MVAAMKAVKSGYNGGDECSSYTNGGCDENRIVIVAA